MGNWIAHGRNLHGVHYPRLGFHLRNYGHEHSGGQAMNKDYIIHDAQGHILRTGNCPPDMLALQAQAGECCIEGVADCARDRVDVTNKTVMRGAIARATAPGLVNSHLVTPALSVERQLEMLWESMHAGQFPKSEPFYSAVLAARQASET
jgi:hypothetical protein